MQPRPMIIVPGIDNMMVEERHSFSSRAAKLRKGDSTATTGHHSTVRKDPARRLKPRKHTELKCEHRALISLEMLDLTKPEEGTPNS